MKKNNVTVLYIEDDGMLMNMYESLFTKHGFSFIGAKDFTEGVKKAKSKKPEIILLDLLLPSKERWIPTDLNTRVGFDILEEIKKSPETKNIPVIILTNIDEASAQKRAQELGADGYMIKANVLPKEVLEKTRQTLVKFGIEPPCDPRKEKC